MKPEKMSEAEYKKNYFKSGRMDSLYASYPDPWRLAVDGHDRYLKILTTIDSYFRERNPERIVDLGCGEGVLSRMLARRYQAQVYGIDISQTAVDRAFEDKQENTFFSVCDMGKGIVPLTQKMDVIILGDILYYLNDKIEVAHAISEVDRLLDVDGIIIMTEFPKTRKYVKLLSERFDLIHESREVVRYKKTPIDLKENSQLTYRLTVFRRKEQSDGSSDELCEAGSPSRHS